MNNVVCNKLHMKPWHKQYTQKIWRCGSGEMHADNRQRNIQTDTVITILRTPTGRSKNSA